MKTSYTSILLLMFSFTTPFAWAQDTIPLAQPERVSLKLDLKPQTSYRFISNSTQKAEQEIMGTAMETTIQTTAHYLFEVEQNDGQETKIKATYERIAVQMQMPQDTLNIDTDQGAQLDNQTSGSYDKLASLINQPFYIFLDQQGKVSKVEGLSEGEKQQNDGEFSALQESLNGHHFLAEIEKTFYIFPKDSVSMGETWGITQNQRLNHQIELNIEKAFTMEGLSEDLAWINIDHKITSTAPSSSIGEVNLSGTQQGTIELDRVSGLIMFSESNQALEGLIHTNGIDIPLKITSSSTLKGEML